jgi:hypothetical protein
VEIEAIAIIWWINGLLSSKAKTEFSAVFIERLSRDNQANPLDPDKCL